MRMECSKKILVASWALALVLTAIVVLGTFFNFDTENIYLLAALAFAELTAAHGFYYWKAKNENRAKGTQKLVKDLAEQYGIDSVARIAEIIFKD